MTEAASRPDDRSASTAVEVTETARTRWARRVFAGGVALGLLGAVVTGLLGVPGRVGVLVVLLGSALGAALAAVTLFATALIDEFRGYPVPGRRLLWGLAAFVGAIALLIALLGMEP